MKRTAVLLTLMLTLMLSVSSYFIAIPARSASPPVVIIFMEEESATAVNGSPDMPYLHAFAAAGRYFSSYTEGNATGPSLPDYLQVAAGSSCGSTTNTITAGGVPTSVCPTTLWNQLQTAGVSWGVFEDGMPTPCAANVTYRNVVLNTPYALKQNPATPFASVWSNQALCQAHVLPFTSFNPAVLPTVSFIAPGICNDQHGTTNTGYTNCLPGSSVLYKRGDDWLAARVPAMLAAGATVFITYDEGGTTLYAAEQGPGIAPSIDARPYSHYSVLAALEDRYGLPRLAGAIGVSPLPIGGGLPAVTSFNPSSGQVGDPVTITGSGLTGASALTFGGQSQSTFTVDSDTSISTTVPDGALTGVICVTIPVNTGCSVSTFTVTTASPIRHVVIIDMENQSFDSILGKFCAEQAAGQLVRAGSNDACDGATVGTLSSGAKLALTVEPDHGLTINHSYANQIAAIDGGKMDGFDKISPGCTPTSSPAYGCFVQFDPLIGACGITGTSTCVPNGFTLAKDYALSDRMFELRATPSWAGHMVLGSATIERFVGELPAKSPLFKSGMPNTWGCDSGFWAPWLENGVRINVPSCIPDANGSLGPIWNGTPYASQPHAYYVPTIFDRLDTAGISWKIYQDQPIWSICPTFQECLDSQMSHDVATTQLLTDTTNHALPAVSWVIPKGIVSEHQPQSASKGDAWIGQIVSEIQADSADWPTTAVFITWDDCGCFYDHVNPLVLSPKWGVRVPLLAVSPYARTGFTDHTPATFGSLLTYIERNFSIPPLNPCAATPGDPACSDDVVGATGTPAYDLSGMFDYSQTPILAPLGLVTSVHLSQATRRYLAAHSVEHDYT